MTPLPGLGTEGRTGERCPRLALRGMTFCKSDDTTCSLPSPLTSGLPAAPGWGHCQGRPQDLVVTGVTRVKLIFLFLWGRQR